MKVQLFGSRRIRVARCVLLTALMASLPSASSIAQGLGATQSARGRAFGLAPSPESPPPETPPPAPPATPESPPSAPPTYAPPTDPGKLDTTYVSPNAIAVVVVRPSQFVTSPVAQILPLDAIKAMAQRQIGVDLADIEEIVMFGEMTNPISPGYGVTFKFKQPFRAMSIPETWRVGTALADFNEKKKYLQGTAPGTHSFYGPDNKTLVVAPDAVLRKIVQSSAEPKSGPLLDRIRDVPSGSDLYAFVDLSTIGTLLPTMAAQSGITLPPAIAMALPKLSSAELTLNLASRGPVACVLHCTDEAAAQEIEGAISAMDASSPSGAPSAPETNPNSMAGMANIQLQFAERLKQKFRPQRSGADIAVRIEADDPLQPQLLGILLGMAMASESKSMAGGMPGMPGEPPQPGQAPPPEAAPPAGKSPAASRGDNIKGLRGGVILEN